MSDKTAIIKELISKFSDRSWYVRKQAASEVVQYGEDAFNFLMESARDRNDDVRFWSYNSLAQISS